MAKGVTPINFFDKDNWSGGGGFFPDGRARIESARFGTFDYGKAGNDSEVAIITFQPLTDDGKDNGEPKVQYYGLGRGIELLSPVKGEKGMFSQIGLAADSEYDKLFRFSDFGFFIEYLGKTTFDTDAVDGDITALDGLEGNFVKVEKPKATKKKSKDDDGDGEEKKPQLIVVCTEVYDESNKPTASKGKGKAAEKEEAPAKGKGKGKSGPTDEPESIVEAYLEEILVDDNVGAQSLGLKMGCAAWAMKTHEKDADVARAAQAYLKSNWDELLTGAGWEVKGSKISRSK